MNKNFKRLVLVASLWGMTAGVFASSEDLRNYIDIFRSDLSAGKKQAITEAMRLTDAEAKVFWPIYREYEVQLAKIGDERVALIEKFMTAQQSGTLDDKLAKEITEKSFAFYQKRFDLWKKYHAKLAKALSPVRAAQFLQVEHQVSLFIDLGIASEMPLIGSKSKE